MAACSSDDDVVLIQDVNGVQTISAEIIQPGSISSRVVVGGNPGDPTRPFTWRVDDPSTKANEADAIYVYDSKGNAARFVYSEKTPGTAGIFTRDAEAGTPLVDIKNALCVPSSVGVSKQLPTSANAEFNYMNTMLNNRGAENVPMYGELVDNKLQFTPMAGMVEVVIKNFDEVKKALADNKDAKNQMGIKLVAYGADGQPKNIASTKAKLNVANQSVEFISGGKEYNFIGLMVMEVANRTDNKFYFPMVAGDYSKFEVSIHPMNSFKPAMVKTVTITPKEGKIANKIYSFEETFEIKSTEVLDKNEEGVQTLSAKIIQPGSISSRVIVGGKPGDETRPFTWRADDPATKASEADVIYAYDTKGNAARFVYSEPKDGEAGIFTRDTAIGKELADVKNAFCVPSSVGVSKQLPTSIEAEFNYMNTMLHHRGVENVPMYGELKDGELVFHPMAGMVEVVVKNFDEIKAAIAKHAKAKNQMGIKLTAYGADGSKKIIASTKAKLDVANKTVTFLEGGNEKDFIGQMVLEVANQKDNKFYFPVVAGDYSKLEIAIHPFNAFEPAITETVVFEPKDGKVANKIYTCEQTFKLK